MKRGKKMFVMIVVILGVIGLIAWGVIAYLGRSQTLSIKAIENPGGDLYLLHLGKNENMTWEAGSYAKFTLPEENQNRKEASDTVSGATKSTDECEQNSRWLTIASTPDENEILILTHNSGSTYKKNLISLHKGSEIKMSWLLSSLKIEADGSPLVCFASDVGIVAIRPIIKEWAGQREMVLSHLDKGVTVFDKEMAELSNQKGSFNYETSNSLSQSQATLKNAIEQYGNKAAYLLAGQPDDVKAMKKFLVDKGIDSKNIKTESFRGVQ